MCIPIRPWTHTFHWTGYLNIEVKPQREWNGIGGWKVDEVEKENQTPTDYPAADDEDIEPSQPAKLTMPRDRYCWLKKNLISPDTNFYGTDVTSGAVSFQTPMEYFQSRGLSQKDMIRALTENTNQYSYQNTGTTINTNTKEIDRWLAYTWRCKCLEFVCTGSVCT